MDKRLLFCAWTAIAACGTDEAGTQDGGPDASSDATIDAAKDAGSDAAPDVAPDVHSCDASTACGSPTECPATGTECIARTCPAGCCGTALVDAGVACTNDGGKVCDGTGHCVACNGPSDCTTTTTCQSPICTSNGCGATNVATGTACNEDGGKVCDGTGKCVECSMPSDCFTQTTCMAPTCNTNVCGTNNTAIGTACNEDGGTVCDGTGNCVACNSPSDCPTQITTCKSNTCSGNACGSVPAATGTFCNDNKGHVCDGTGMCVQCNQNTDCLFYNDAGTLSCTSGKCI